jgi:hypothetical protein
MGPRGIDAEIDRLYQLPLEEFTPARNTLAKRAGSEAARVRGLSKPPIAAWAVNQLYWKHGDLWNALVAAAENAQRAHRAVLAGKAADVRAASKVHEDAVDKALRATLALLAEAKHPATDTTKHAIGTTLRAVPGDEPPGRFTRTLQPAGFGMLTGIAIAPGAPAKRQKPAPAPGPTRTSTRAEPKVDAKALTRARQAAAAAAEALRTAEAAVRREEFERVRTEREETRAATAVEKAREASERAAAELAEAVAAAKEATRLRDAAAKRATAAEAALPRARKDAAAAASDLHALEKGR